ncbi:hypothetical protein Tco_0265141 [Tanacetum coccineum]
MKSRNRVNSYAARITKMIADIEDRHHGPKHPSETIVFHNEDGNPARANIKQALGYLKDGDGDGNSQPHKGVKASANSDIMYFFTSAQDGDPSQDDVRLCLGDDLKKAQDHSQRQATTLEGTYQNWLSRISKPSPRTNEFGDLVKLSDPKQALRGRQPMLIRLFRIFKASRAHGLCPSITRASHPQLHLGNPIS